MAGFLWRVGERLEKVFGDQAYNGVFAAELAQWSIDRWRPRSFAGSSKIASTPRSAVAVSSSVAWLYLANSQIMLQRIEAYNQT